MKAPERAAFEKHLPEDVHIISIHSLHGPTVSPEGQPLVRPVSLSFLHSPVRPSPAAPADLARPSVPAAVAHQVLIQHRAPDEKLRMVEDIFRGFGSKYVYLSYEEHDLVTANTQAVTHAAFLSSVPLSSTFFSPWLLPPALHESC